MILLKNLLGLVIAVVAGALFLTILGPLRQILGELMGPGLGGLVYAALFIAFMLLVAKYVRKTLWKGRSLADLKPEESEEK